MPNNTAFLQHLRLFFDCEWKKKLAEENDIKKILQTLNDKRRHILQEIAETENTDQVENLRRELQIIEAQRQKGLTIVKRLNDTNP